MARFWDERAQEDPFFFVDNTGRYRRPDLERFWEAGEEELDRLLGAVGAELARDDVVLDLGCGVGRLTRVLAARVAHVHALDASAEMIGRGRELNAELHNVTWHLGDGTTLAPHGDESLDAVVSHVVFQHIPDPAITLGYVREIGRVLREGGWAAFQVSNDPGLHAPRHKPPGRLKVALGLAPRGQRDPRWIGAAVNLDELAAAAAEGGMKVEAVHGAGTQFCFVRTVKACMLPRST
jgi:SAM-dependent methyltransferase